RRRWRHTRRAGRFAVGGPPGGWSILQPPAAGIDADEVAEAVATTLLDRYGVVFRDVVRRESFRLPWRDVLRALRRLEARGEVRGGRFVAGFAGEQFALPDAVNALRRARRDQDSGETLRLAAVDPLNLTGVITPDARVPAQPGRQLTLVNAWPSPPDPAAAEAAAS
ncbi:MAG: DEAD/DEAH box helicase, partial [Chloroflexota bacterium]|nr:DEAD/DEAH box helicase [Chloroflexota bacterium]